MQTVTTRLAGIAANYSESLRPASTFLADLREQRAHLCHDVGVLGGDVFRLTRIDGKVVKLRR